MMINEINNPTQLSEQLLTVRQAMGYIKCSNVFLWKRRKEGVIKTVNAGKKVLLTKSSIDHYLKLNEIDHG